MICPLCHSALIAMRVQAEDGSGWLFGWTCHCDTQTRASYDDNEIFVWSGIANAGMNVEDFLADEVAKA